MKKFDYLEINIGSTGLCEAKCTDPKTIEWIEQIVSTIFRIESKQLIGKYSLIFYGRTL